MAQSVATARIGSSAIWRLAHAGAMSRHRSSLRDRAAVGELPPDLYVVPGPWPRLGRRVKHDVETWRVVDD